ncbi:MAG: hypothetical protein KDA74_10075 [Planctomycetaceae bacterium]|nr:hypothetical protein [Planctomycetaceae bacterium]
MATSLEEVVVNEIDCTTGLSEREASRFHCGEPGKYQLTSEFLEGST